MEREKTTVQVMLRLYCKEQHHMGEGLCSECQELKDYALARLTSCKFGENKPTCGKCLRHCYKPVMQKRIREIMKYSGPKMLIQHPMLAIRHWVDGLMRSN